jgi:signal transduction histidine kinase
VTCTTARSGGLVVLGQALDLALRELERDPERARQRLAAGREQTSLAGRELRDLARGLHPVGLERGLASALAALAAQAPIPVRVDALGGRLAVVSPPGAGTRLTAAIPL